MRVDVLQEAADERKCSGGQTPPEEGSQEGSQSFTELTDEV